jgi:hypothetical protein
MDTQTHTIEFPMELDYRENNGIHVWLLWLPRENTVTVRVVDMKSGTSFELPADRDPLDVFHHPFAYAALLQMSVEPEIEAGAEAEIAL